VPAGCNNLVGLKPTPGLLSTEGVLPACRSLDCVSIMALTVADAATILGVASGNSAHGATVTERRPAVFAVPRDDDLEFFGDDAQSLLFHQAVSRLEKMGSRRVTVDLRPFREVASLLYDGPWVAERLAGIRDFMRDHADVMHPVTRQIIQKGAVVTGVDVFRGIARLSELSPTCLKVFEQAEVMVVPTMPTIPTLAQAHTDSLGCSSRMGVYTNFVNLLRLAALALPSGFTPRGLPGGITLIGPGGTDARLCAFGLAWQRELNLPLGATGASLPAVTVAEDKSMQPPEGYVRVSVAGAHMRGQPLHPALLQTGAKFVRSCRTAPCYRFKAFMDLKPPRPGLLRVDEGGGSVLVELYDLAMEGFGRLVASVAPPLAIGTVELEDGASVKGFLCESSAAAKARDITDFGGWVPFREQTTEAPR
jgi:allophanate hydrolase